MYYILDEKGKIAESADFKFCDDAIYTEEEIVFDCDGHLVFKQETETEEHQQKIINKRKYYALKDELAKIKEDIEQEAFGLVRGDYAEKKARAAEIINELRVLEGKEPREVKE